MLTHLANIPSITRITNALSKGSTHILEELWDTPKAIIAALLAKRPILIITANERDTFLYEDLKFFDTPVATFPAWETLPGEDITPSADIVGKRMQLLHTLANGTYPVVLAPIQSVLQKVLPKEELLHHTRTLSEGETIPFEEMPKLLHAMGYVRCLVASDKGEYAIRGGIIDIYPISAFDPVRLDFFGDQIETIRTYDPLSQKTTGTTKEVFLSHASEHALLRKCTNPESLLTYFPDNALVFFDDLTELEDKAVAIASLPSSQSRYILPFQELYETTKPYPRLLFTKTPVSTLAPNIPPGATEVQFDICNTPICATRLSHAFAPVDEIASHKNAFLIADTESEEKSMRSKLPLRGTETFIRGYLSTGVVIHDDDLILYPYTELSHRKKVTREKWRNTYHTPPSEFHELKTGDLVVHFHNGIGKYLGIEKRINHLGQEEEFMMIQYAEGGTLYAPLSQSHLISRYIGSSEEMPTLHKLGTKTWQNQKVRAQKSIIGYAKDLIKYQAMRDVHGGYAFPSDGEEVKQFEEEFPFTETTDQLKAIHEVKTDMMTLAPMDRLVCGDVGYGKTEVAMRATIKAVLDGGKQVAVLAPTTVLAMQHYETFCERMAGYPIRIEALSRFVKQKKQKEVLEATEEGTVDILIGTHRLISKDVAFKRLGLIIIDEEQRFGVRAKEHLKKRKIGVDCLTLSATPIPRTLYFSLVGARPMSVISTPPQDRLPIKTVLADNHPELIKNALQRELAHDGQAYFVHNRVESIYGKAKEIQELLPSAKVGIVHGQMSPDEIDTAFHSFKSGVTDILCATTIVESGIDIPNANTILIDKAHHYGLADLYQLRGRVGRWNKPAYAYFLIPKNTEVPEIARKRLNALVEASGFGGGMKLAMRDLEIRGAGDLLGTQQSGNVSSIGFHLYCKLLKRAIETMKKDLQPDFTDVKMEFPYPASIPSSYIEESSLRIEFYHRLGDALTFEEAEAVLEELKDRFGKPPIEMLWLYRLTRIRIRAAEQKITTLQFGQKTLVLESHASGKAAKTTLYIEAYATPDELEAGTFRIFDQLSKITQTV